MSVAPHAEHQRAAVLDVLRGFALLGIFLAHVPGFSGWDYLSPEQHLAIDGEFDSILQYFRNLLVRGKFYSLFSMLFGFGFSIQLASAARSGDVFASRFRRRQFGLLLIGVLHSLAWQGDILLKYALLGLLLMPCANWSGQKLFRLAVACLIARGLWGFLPWIATDLIAEISTAATGGGGGEIDGSIRATLAGSYSDHWHVMLAGNWTFLKLKWLYVLYEGKLISIVGFFALGAAFGRWRVHARTVELRPVLLRVLWIGGGVGLVGNAILAVSWEVVPMLPPSGLRVAQGMLMSVAVPSLALAMAAGIALAWDSGGRRWLAWLAAPGRMALSTYLAQTAIAIGTFYGVGLAWRGNFSLAMCCAFAVTVFIAQAILAQIWLRHFSFGPVEWLWRCATYGRWLPLLRSTRVVATPVVADAAGKGLGF